MKPPKDGVRGTHRATPLSSRPLNPEPETGVATVDSASQVTAVIPRQTARDEAAEPEEAEPKGDGPGYTLPEPQESAWSAGPSPRRAWLSRGILLGILAVQALLSLRLGNTAFQDEALYIFSGHLQLDHWQNGTPLKGQFETYFSGAPVLYPVLAAFVDTHFGLSGVRFVSLLFVLGATALLYSFTRLLFNERVALCAAGSFAVIESTIFVGSLATYDAPALFLLALAAWLVVRAGYGRSWLILPAGAVAALAVAVKYASALYLPTIVGLAVLAAWPRLGRRALIRGVVFTAVTTALVAAAAYFSGYLDAVRSTTTDRPHGTAAVADLFLQSAKWGGALFALALVGSVLFVRRGRMSESPIVHGALPGWKWRVLLALLLCGTALLAPTYQAYIHTTVSLHKHIGYGLLFAAPMAGVGLARMMGAHFRFPQIVIMAWVVMLVFGMSQSARLYHDWPDSKRLIETLRTYTADKPKGRYLVEVHEVPAYYLRDEVGYTQWNSTYVMSYRDKSGKAVTGLDGFRLAIKESYFDLVVLDGRTTPGTDRVITEALNKNPKYRQIARIPYTTSTGSGTYAIWGRG